MLLTVGALGGCITIVPADGLMPEGFAPDWPGTADSGGTGESARQDAGPDGGEPQAEGVRDETSPDPAGPDTAPDTVPKDEGFVCQSNDDCAAGEECKDGKCVKPDPCKGVNCPATECCHQGQCVDCHTHYCKPCKLRSDCAPGGICVSSAKGQFCSARCSAQLKCPAGASCVNLGPEFGDQCVPTKGEC